MTKGLYPVSRLLANNASRVKDYRRVLWVNPPGDQAWRALQGYAPAISLFSQEFSAHDWLKKSGAESHFGDFPEFPAGFLDLVILTLQRGKQQLEMMLHSAHRILKPDGVLWLAGENRAGIRSAEIPMGRWFGEVTRLDYGSHCVLYQARAPLPAAPFDPLTYQQKWTCIVRGSQVTVCSWPGIFSHGRLDEGTALLLEHMPMLRPGSSVLDFGCGSGVIGAGLARACPGLDLTLADSNALALRAAGCTLRINHLQGAVLPSHGLGGLTRSYDLIISNPPFHQGTATDTGMSMELLHGVRNFLNPKGQLVLVVNRHIPYRKWLDGIFGKHDVLAFTSRYQVLHAVQSG